MGAAKTETQTDAHLDLRSLARSTVLGIVLLMLVVTALGMFFREPLVALSKTFVDRFGGPGVAIGFYLPDAFTIPIPNDVFTTFGIVAGMPFWHVVGWGTLGSIAGGATGFFIGRKLAKNDALARRFKALRNRRVRALVRLYGPAAVAIAALTPLPYSIVCWAAGAGGMHLRPFLTVSLLRGVRVAGFLYLIDLGLVASGL